MIKLRNSKKGTLATLDVEATEKDKFGHEWEQNPHPFTNSYTCRICSAQRHGKNLNEWTWWSNISVQWIVKNGMVNSFYCEDELIRSVMSQ